MNLQSKFQYFLHLHFFVLCSFRFQFIWSGVIWTDFRLFSFSHPPRFFSVFNFFVTFSLIVSQFVCFRQVSLCCCTCCCLFSSPALLIRQLFCPSTLNANLPAPTRSRSRILVNRLLYAPFHFSYLNVPPQAGQIICGQKIERENFLLSLLPTKSPNRLFTQSNLQLPQFFDFKVLLLLIKLMRIR